MRIAITDGTGLVGGQLSEEITEPEPPSALDQLPGDLSPRTRFDDTRIRKGSSEPGGFHRTDLRCCAPGPA